MSSNSTALLPVLALIEIDDAADLLVAVGAAHNLQFVGRFHLAEPGAQILLRRIGERFRDVKFGGRFMYAFLLNRCATGAFMPPPGRARAVSWRARDRGDSRRLC